MDQRLKDLLSEMESFGKMHDSENAAHLEQMLNVTPDTGLFLSILIRAIRPKKVLEIGTSNAYSTLWIADALQDGDGRVTTVEVSERKAKLARENIARSGLAKRIDLHHADIRAFLRAEAAGPYDFIFLDAERPQYLSYWQELDRVLKKRSLLVVDNAHSPHAEELAEFFEAIEDSKRFLTQTVRVGKGEFLAMKLRDLP